jgi:lipopolysaccharide/colanic/teichoic acid biosynthesis glycosyltransferase
MTNNKKTNEEIEVNNDGSNALATNKTLLDIYGDSVTGRSILKDETRDYILIKDQNDKYPVGKVMRGINIPHIIEPRKGKWYAFWKRSFDIFASLLALIVLSPLMIITGILVKCTSKGPMIYVSKRVGKDGKVFKFYKFRSMVVNADALLSDLRDQNEIEGGVTFKMKNDPRITKFGKFIRKTSIDELPQLVNILKGDMSIIGPRCALPSEVEKYTREQLDRLLVPQGLSGEWQANGRSNTTFEEMVRMDLDYIQNKQGLFHDLGLIFKTFWVVFSGKGAE